MWRCPALLQQASRVSWHALLSREDGLGASMLAHGLDKGRLSDPNLQVAKCIVASGHTSSLESCIVYERLLQGKRHLSPG